MASAKRRPRPADAPSEPVGDGGLAADVPGDKVIYNAAIVAMSEQGYHGTSVRDIADRAGMSSAAIYHHFSSKQDLLFEITNQGIEALVRTTEKALRDCPDDPVARLRAVVRVQVLANTEDQRGSFIGNSEIRSLEPPNRAIVVSKRDQQKRFFDRVVHDGVKRGVFTTPYPREATMAIVTMCTAVAQWYRSDGPLRPEEIANRYADLSLAMLGHRPRRTRAAAKAPALERRGGRR